MSPSASASETASAAFYAAVGAAGLAGLVDPAKTRADLRFVRGSCRGARDLLDLGCGYGRIAIPLARRWRVTGIDLDPHLVRAARRGARAAGVRLRLDVGSMLALPYPAASFDRVLCLWSSFQHLLTVRDQVRALDEMARVLRPGGLALIETVDGGQPAVARRLAREGRGRGRRIASWRLAGGTITVFIHDRATLGRAIARSRFAEAELAAVAIHGPPRLVARCRLRPAANPASTAR